MSDWDHGPRLDERRANALDVSTRGKKKNTRRWCKGKVGIEHQLEVVLDERTVTWRSNNYTRPACYRPDWLVNTKRGSQSETWSWLCSHVKRCASCGKIVDHFVGKDCPNYTSDVTVFREQEIAKLRNAVRKDTT